MTECSCCGRMYRDDGSAPACANCGLAGGCGRSRCPYCGYENVRALLRGEGAEAAAMGPRHCPHRH